VAQFNRQLKGAKDNEKNTKSKSALFLSVMLGIGFVFTIIFIIFSKQLLVF